MNRKSIITFFWFFIFCGNGSANITDKEYALLPPLFHQDNYDNCMLLEDEALYCSFEYHLEPLDTNTNNSMWKTIQKISSNTYNYNHDILRHWICVPLTCPNCKKNSTFTSSKFLKEINKCYDKKFSSYGLKGKVENLNCETNISEFTVDWVDQLALIFFASYTTIVLFCTFCDLISSLKATETHQKINNSKLAKIIQSFSLINNWRRLVSISDSPDVQYLKPLQGVRFYNTILVILSHTSLGTVSLPVSNPKYVETMNSKMANLFLSSGPLCVSTFFFLSAALLTYGIFTQFENRKLSKKVLVVTFVNRYLRLTPALAVIILFNLTWWPHLGSGPNWHYVIGKEYSRCRKNWWTNLLFVNTFIDKEHMCSPIFWYLALDTQYFILLLVLIWYIKKNENYIWPILGSLLSLNIIGTFTNNYMNDFEGLLIPRAEQAYQAKLVVENPQWHGQMVSIIGNTAGPILGVGFGYLSFKTKNMKLFQEKRFLWQILYHILSFGLALGILLISGWYILIYQQEHEPVTASIISAMGRPVFLMGIGITLFGAMHNIGGPMGNVLNWYPAYMLARIAYSAYLVHFTIIISRPAISRGPVYVNDIYIFYFLLGDLATSYLVGLVMTLFFEMPMSALQKLMMPALSRKEQEVKKEK